MSSIIPIRAGHRPVPGTFEPLLALFRKTNAMIAVWQVRKWRRAELRRLLRGTPHLIADIGLDYGEALSESRKAPWQA